MRLVAVSSILVVLLLALAGTASAAQPVRTDSGPQTVQQVDQTDRVTTANEVSHTFSKRATQRLYRILHTGGIAAATTYCFYEAPIELKPFCAGTVAILLAMFEGSPDEDECYQVFAKTGWPPVGGRMIKC